MKNYFKKFSIMFAMSLVLILGSCVSAFADDSGVVGTTNLNNTAENSAKVGDILTTPEIGWKRYDDTNSNIKYTGSWRRENYSTDYKSTDLYGPNCSFAFKFYGTKFRLIGCTNYNHSQNIKITIDGVSSTFSQYTSNILRQPLFYESNTLQLGMHDITVSNNEDLYLSLDAVDIDDTGYLVDTSASISLNKSTENLPIGQTDNLIATTTPAGEQITWTSSDSSIATVDSNGKVTGVKEGTCTITAASADGLTATCSVTVSKGQSGESISLNKSASNLTIGNSDTLVATTTPSAVNVKWSSSNTSVATVDQNGKVTAIGAGTATITAVTTDGSNLSASCIVTVADSTNPNPTPDSGTDTIVNIAHAKGDNTNNAGGGVTITFHGTADTTLSVVKTADVKDVWIGDNFTYTIVVTNTGSKTAKAVVLTDPAPNHIDFTVDEVTTTQGKVDSSSTSKNIIVDIGDIEPSGTVTIKIPATVIA